MKTLCMLFLFILLTVKSPHMLQRRSIVQTPLMVALSKCH